MTWPTAERTLAGSLLLFAVALPWSIAIAQVALTAAIAAWWLAPGPRVPASARAAVAAALAFAAATMLAALQATDPRLALWDSKHLFQLALLALVPRALRFDPALRRSVPVALLCSGALSASFGLVRFLLDGGGLEHRARGPFGHYMAFAGVLMLVSLTTAGWLLQPEIRARTRGALALAFAVLASALGASYVRSSWLGLLAGVSVMAYLRRPRSLLLVGAAVLAAGLLAPASMRDRAASILDLGANQDRVEMVSIGLRMARDHALRGVGPANVAPEYLTYEPTRPQPHLHNNILQLTVERGVPGLAAWLLMLFFLVLGAWRSRSREPREAAPLVAIGAVGALLVAGLFEYNFGDSEVAMTFLLLTALSLEPAPRPETA